MAHGCGRLFIESSPPAGRGGVGDEWAVFVPESGHPYLAAASLTS